MSFGRARTGGMAATEEKVSRRVRLRQLRQSYAGQGMWQYWKRLKATQLISVRVAQGIVILRMDTVEYLRQVFQVLLLAIQDFWDMFIYEALIREVFRLLQDQIIIRMKML